MRSGLLCGRTGFRGLVRGAACASLRTIAQSTPTSTAARTGDAAAEHVRGKQGIRAASSASSSSSSAAVSHEALSLSSSAPMTGDCATILKYPYQVVKSEAELQEAVAVLQRSRHIAMDVEALCTPEATKTPQLGRVSLVQTCSDAAPVVFLFDVLTLSVPVFAAALRPIFESEAIRKLFFDCRRDIEALSSQMGLVPKRVLDIQLLFTAAQWKLRSVNRRSGMTYVLKSVAGLHRQESDSAVQTAMLLGDRPVWDTRPLPEHFLEYAADDVRHIHLLSTYLPSLTEHVSEDAVERLTEQYVQHYGVGQAVTAEADAQPAQVNAAWLERYIGPGGVCRFCGSKGHTESECFRKQNGNVRCSFCGGTGHTSRNCFQKHPELLKCDRCGQLGHSTANCFRANPCKHCGGNHRSENCHKRVRSVQV